MTSNNSYTSPDETTSEGMSSAHNSLKKDCFEGCLLGLALGDALGASREGGLIERLLWRFIGTTRHGEMRWTDDTQMSLDVAECLSTHGQIEPDDLAKRFAASYRWSRGYGPGAAKLLKRIARGWDWQTANRSVYPEGSYGNGGAMRAPLIGLFFAFRAEDLIEAARMGARITHAHPLGEEGAVLIAVATARAALGESGDAILGAALDSAKQAPFRERLEIARRWLKSSEAPTFREVRKYLGNGISASESCVTAIYCALRYKSAPFLEMQHFIASLGGDVDTIGAMAGAIWGAANGVTQLPTTQLSRLEQRERLIAVAAALHARFMQGVIGGSGPS